MSMNNSRHLRPVLIIFALLIFVVSLLVSNLLVTALGDHVKDLEAHVKDFETHVNDLESHVKELETVVEERKKEEFKKMELWVEAMRCINNADGNTDLTLAISVLESNNTIPVVVLDGSGDVSLFRNIEFPAACDADSVIYDVVERAKEKGYVIRMELAPNEGYLSICYNESLALSHLSGIQASQSELLESQSILLASQSVLLDSQSELLSRLSYYPYIQLGVVVLFFIICFVAVLSSKRAEQNRVWVGLSKETAHQLGTPISSLMAWVEVLKAKYADDELLPEMERDVQRLQMVADRFSKIGSRTEPVLEDVAAVVGKAVEYMKRRSPAKVQYKLSFPDTQLSAHLNAPLMEWVFENLCKNAIDAMEGCGEISVVVTDDGDKVLVDVADTGKGIAKSRWKMIFEPGFTTKPRGWGLGLSLAKRIVEEFHKGRIYIKKSLPGKGTTFRIELKK